MKRNFKYLQQLTKYSSVSKYLFCFHHAGGSALMYRDWPENFPSDVGIVSVELPGRGMSFNSDLVSNLHHLLTELSKELILYSGYPCYFFGHSLGAHISFHLALLLQESNPQFPMHIIVSGRSAPSDEVLYYPKMAGLPESEFRELLSTFGGTPKEILANDELMSIYLPVLKADFELSEKSFKHCRKLNCPLTVFGGKEDRMPEEKLRLWSQETKEKFSLEMFSGDHFFVESRKDEVATLVSKICSEMY